MQIIFQCNSGTLPDQAQSRLESGCCMQRPLGGATPLMLLEKGATKANPRAPSDSGSLEAGTW